MDFPADFARLLENLIQYGTVTTVDLDAARVRVTAGEVVTDWIPWLTGRAGRSRATWSPPSVGEQVILLCPSGDPKRGICLPSVFSLDNAAPDPVNPDENHVDVYSDNAVISYNAATHALTAQLPAGATVLIVADGGMKFQGDVDIDGALKVSKTIHADDVIDSSADVKAGNISLAHHKTTGVQPGGGLSGDPQ